MMTLMFKCKPHFQNYWFKKPVGRRTKKKKCFIDPLNYLFFLLKTNFFDIFEMNTLQEK